jgi:hypothetical protein
LALPEPEIGLVVCYGYLWHRRKAASAADKSRPACVIATYREDDGPDRYVVYLPISHSAPTGDEVGYELPDNAKRRCGLDRRRQWVILSECNVDIWPYDLQPVPRRPGVFHYGYMPPKVFRAVRDTFVAAYRARKVGTVRRY